MRLVSEGGWIGKLLDGRLGLIWRFKWGEHLYMVWLGFAAVLSLVRLEFPNKVSSTNEAYKNDRELLSTSSCTELYCGLFLCLTFHAVSIPSVACVGSPPTLL